MNDFEQSSPLLFTIPTRGNKAYQLALVLRMCNFFGGTDPLYPIECNLFADDLYLGFSPLAHKIPLSL